MDFNDANFENYLEHSKKGSSWKNHKYIRIENGRYIYSESKGDGKGGLSYGKGTSGDRAATLNELHTLLKSFKLAGKGGKKSSSKSSKKEKEAKEKKSSSKEKQEKSSSAKEAGGSSKEEKVQTASNEGEKKLLNVDERYNNFLEEHKKKKDSDKNLKKIRARQKFLESRKILLRHSEDGDIFYNQH